MSGVVRIDAVSVVGIAVLNNPIQRLLQSVGRRFVYVNPHQRLAVVFACMLCLLCIDATCIKSRCIAFYVVASPPFVHESPCDVVCVHLFRVEDVDAPCMKLHRASSVRLRIGFGSVLSVFTCFESSCREIQQVAMTLLAMA